MTVLSHQTIKRLCSVASPLIVDHAPENIRTAAYDLRLGQHYYLSNDGGRGSRIRVGELDAASPAIEIPANQILLFATIESLQMPRDMVGHLSLKLDLLLHGLMMASQSQIDAGYEGPLFGLLYNLSDRPVTLKYGDAVFRLEFRKLDEPSALDYDGSYGPGMTLGAAIPYKLSSSLHTMREEIDKNRRRTYVGAGSIVLATLALLIGFYGPLQDAVIDSSGAAKGAESVAGVALNAASAKGDAALEARIADLERQIQVLRTRYSERDGARVEP